MLSYEDHAIRVVHGNDHDGADAFLDDRVQALGFVRVHDEVLQHPYPCILKHGPGVSIPPTPGHERHHGGIRAP